MTEALDKIKGPAEQDTRRLVLAFADALMAKLGRAEVKYGYTTGWARDDWETECRQQLAEHVQKGDPLYVAAYAAFCWAHRWSTATPPSASLVEARIRKIMEAYADDGMDLWRALGEPVPLRSSHVALELIDRALTAHPAADAPPSDEYVRILEDGTSERGLVVPPLPSLAPPSDEENDR